MKKTYRFKSILMKPERVDKTGMATYDIVTNRTIDIDKLFYDMTSVRDHILEAGLLRMILCRSWIPSFFIALMAVIILFGLIYGFMVIGLKIDVGSAGNGLVGRLFLLSAFLVFIIIWLAVGVPAMNKKLKWDYVVMERGPGAWKIIDEDKWDRFHRLVVASKEHEKN